MAELFENATRLRLRFDSVVGQRGSLSVEDLWDLPLTSASKPSLDSVAKACNRDLKAEEEESFVVPTKKSSVNELKLTVVKHIIDVRLSENAAAKKAADNKAEKERIMQILAQRQDNALLTASEEELQRRLAELSANE